MFVSQKRCLIVGGDSDIAKAITPMLKQDGWTVASWTRKWRRAIVSRAPWDLCFIAIGTVAPVGLWHQNKRSDWDKSIRSNLTLPIHILRQNWKYHNPGATVIFLAGSNPNEVLSGYSGYCAGKMALLKACEQLDAETPDAKFIALGPGTILTKIHKPTIAANWPNDKLKKAQLVEFSEKDYQAKMRRVYDAMNWCCMQPKEVVGGRNICVSDFDKYPKEMLARMLLSRPSMWKLRRME
jgi:NAD(P)-dependent dehydrogenase (short-subunit alcohol dehydrogenase family)